MMKISIITIVKDDPSGLQKTIESVLSQDYSEIEHIVVDGGSGKDTLSVIERYQDKISKFIPGPDLGRYDGMNKGIKAATGDIVGLLHAGDVYCDKTIIEKVMTCFEGENRDAVYGDVEFFIGSGRIVRRWRAGTFQKRKVISRGWVPPHLSLFLKRVLFEKYGYFRLDMSIAADYEWMLRFFLDENAVVDYFPHTLVLMSHGGESTRSVRNILKSNLQVAKARKIHDLPTSTITFFNKILWKITQLFFK